MESQPWELHRVLASSRGPAVENPNSSANENYLHIDPLLRDTSRIIVYCAFARQFTRQRAACQRKSNMVNLVDFVLDITPGRTHHDNITFFLADQRSGNG